MNTEIAALLDSVASRSDLTSADCDALMQKAFTLAKTPDEKRQAGRYLTRAIAGRKRLDVDVRSIMGNNIEALNLSYIAKRYFGKSRTWLYQRLNHSMVNGKPAAFTDSELKILSDSLGELSNSIQHISNQLTH